MAVYTASDMSLGQENTGYFHRQYSFHYMFSIDHLREEFYFSSGPFKVTTLTPYFYGARLSLTGLLVLKSV